MDAGKYANDSVDPYLFVLFFAIMLHKAIPFNCLNVSVCMCVAMFLLLHHHIVRQELTSVYVCIVALLQATIH